VKKILVEMGSGAGRLSFPFLLLKFHRCKWKDAVVFKGGTSFSKAYHVIKRF